MKSGEEELEPDGEAGARIYRQQEIADALEALSDVDLLKIRKISIYLAGRAALDPDELRQEAFARILSTRSCKVDVSVVAYVAGVMRSIVSDEYRANKKSAGERGVVVPFVGKIPADPPSQDLSPEDEVVNGEHYRSCMERVEGAIADDDELQFLVEGLCDGLRGKALESFVGTDTKGLAAAKTRLARHLGKAFPEGKPV